MMLRREPDSVGSYMNSALGAYHLEDFAKAVEYYERGLALAGEMPRGMPRQLRADAALAAAFAYRAVGNIKASEAILST